MALTDRLKEVLGAAAAAAFGVVAFSVWAGWTFLDPQNVSWLRAGDRAMHTLGWWFFRATPWGFPLGVNPRNGLEISSSVALSDSLPFFAIPFKLLSPLLPAVFQYWGIWFLTCMVLQGILGYLIGRALNLTRGVSVLLGCALILTPVFVWRLPVHMALAGHWTLLIALWLYVKEKPPRLYAWPLALAVTSSVHAYLLAMALAIWAASLVQRLWLRRIGWGRAALELALGVAATLSVLWAVGFFMTPSLGAEGFGLYRMNLLSFFDPNKWSILLPNLPGKPGDYEGQSFPGLGVLLLLLLGLALAASRVRTVVAARWLPLLLVTIGMAVFAVSDKPLLGSWELGTIPLPQKALDLASMFRASGRMVWPAAYLVVLLAFVLLAAKLKPRVLVAVASVALVIQVADTSRGWSEFAHTQAPPSAAWPTPIQSPFWAFAARHYDKIRAIPVSGMNRNWAELSYFAAFHRMSSDAVYLGRRDATGYSRLEGLADAALDTGQLQPDALYVLGPAAALKLRPYMQPNDFMVGVDGFIVFGRNGRSYAAAEGVTLPPAFPAGDLPSTVGATLASASVDAGG